MSNSLSLRTSIFSLERLSVKKLCRSVIHQPSKAKRKTRRFPFESTEYEYKAPFSTKVNSRQTSPSCSKNCRLSIRLGRKLFLHLFHSSSDSDACSSILAFSCSNICHRLSTLSSCL